MGQNLPQWHSKLRERLLPRFLRSHSLSIKQRGRNMLFYHDEHPASGHGPREALQEQVGDVLLRDTAQPPQPSPPLAAGPYPDEELHQHHVPFPAGQVQGGAPVPVPAGLVHLLPRAVGQEQDHRPQVLLGCGPQEMLAQGELQALQRGEEELLLILCAYPELFFFPREARGDRSLSPGITANKELISPFQESPHRNSSPKP